MKKFILFFVMLFSLTGFAQEVAEVADALDPTFNGLTSFFLPAVLGAALTLFTDTVKHIKDGSWDGMIFLRTKLFPFGLTVAIGVAIYYLLIYIPATKPFIEILAGTGLAEITALSVLGTAAAIIDGLLKSPDNEVVVDETRGI